MPALIDPTIYRCPKCRGRLLAEAAALRCVACGMAYGRLDGYYDFYLPDPVVPESEYPAALEHLLFSEAKILALPEPAANRISDRVFRRQAFNARWTSDLQELKETIRKCGASERNRVEFMVDDRAAPDFIEQKRRTAWKAENIMSHVSRLPRNGGKVLHVGCGGECNEAIPAQYQKAGFVNFGVDAVRSYVKEFAASGEAQLANASALPYDAGVFDVVNFTDILEHLFDPLRGLREAARVLKKNGHLVLETPNRSCLRRRDPLSWLEYFLGRLRPGLLRPRLITARWAGDVLFHTEFSRRELALLLKHAGLTPLKFATEILKKSDAESRGERLRRKLVSALEKIAPSGKWVVIARKA
jgi:SAM-dependent methyltransferase